MDRPLRNLLSCALAALAALAAHGSFETCGAQETAPASAPVTSPVTTPVTTPVITLAEAIQRAQKNEPTFANAVAAQKSAAIDRYLAKAALLPSAVYHNQVLYTQSNGQTIQLESGALSAPIFIANNAVHEYTSQASINETVGLKQLADAQVAAANAARASAELEVARRGLIACTPKVTTRFAPEMPRQSAPA